ncbi:YidB family protein [Pusillimonas sp. MFBS29]|uniref:YidB family protein n=1 Tax=Pusillimonas sp. MFBS29 TaxID=2886690 RepID=UPI001D104843|nr:YidB family protein [Pusillimonas sp. MFBS29]MCC2596948.1 YidB family protein [Pusillimonas sp. MFBS29]
MGLLDSIVSAAGGNDNQGSGQAGLLPVLMELVNNYPGGLAGLLQKFKDAGLGGVVASWIGNGPNEAVTPGQLQTALGDDMVGQLAQRSGQDTDSVLGTLATLLPSLVDQATPNGETSLQSDQNGGLLGGLSGLLGKL